MDFGFEPTFSDFDVGIEDVQIKRTQRFVRVFRIGEGGSFCFTIIHKGVIYATSGDHYIYAINATDGKEMWRFKTGGPNYGSPSTDGSRLFTPSYDGYVYALDINTGQEIWRFKTDGKIFSTPAFSGQTVVFGSEDSNMYALEKGSGKLLWRFKTGGEIASVPTIHEGKVFTGSNDHNFYCVDLETGEEIWRFTTGDDVMLNREIPIKDGRAYFPSLDNNIYCIDVETGKEIWRFRTGKYGNVGPPYLYNNRIYATSRDGIVYALTMDGEEIWRFKTGGMVVKSIVHKGVVYFGSEDNNMYALDAETGEELWRFRTGGKIFDEAKIYGDTLLFGSWDCNYYSLDLRTGEVIWRFHSSSSQQAHVQKLEDEYEMVVKKETQIEDAISEDKYKSKKKGETVSLSDYHVTSEYSSTSEYKQKSDYDTSFVLFEGVMEVEGIWTSDLVSNLPISKWR